MKNLPQLSASSLATYEACLMEARAHRVLVARFRARLKEFGLNSNDWTILGLLAEHGKEGLRISQISTLLHVRTPQGTSMVTSLVERGLVVRKTEAADGRGRRAYLSALGHQLVKDAERELRVHMKDYMKGVSRQKLDTYLGVLHYLASQEAPA